MVKLSNYNDPYDAVTEFEGMLSEFTGAPFVVATDCCTHALELCLRYDRPSGPITLPSNTYVSIPMMLRQLSLSYIFQPITWVSEYHIAKNVFDSARLFKRNMYKPGTMMCLSFGYDKPLTIGHGGAILLDNESAARWLKITSYDGRDPNFKSWHDQKMFTLGYHYMMRPEDAIIGINKILTHDYDSYSENGWTGYPDLSKKCFI